MAESHKSPDDREEENKARPLTEAERSYLAHLSETEGEPLPKRLKEKLEKAKAKEMQSNDGRAPESGKGRGR